MMELNVKEVMNTCKNLEEYEKDEILDRLTHYEILPNPYGRIMIKLFCDKDGFITICYDSQNGFSEFIRGRDKEPNSTSLKLSGTFKEIKGGI